MNEYVFDYADLITDDDEQEIKMIAQELDEKGIAQVVVVTVNSIGNYTIEEFANELFNKWGIGDEKKDNGLLILVNKENLLQNKTGKIRIEVGYGLEGDITDGTAGQILDRYVLPYFNRQQYSEGIKNTFFACVDILKLKTSSNVQGNTKNTNIQSDSENTVWILILIFLIIFLIVYIKVKQKIKRLLPHMFSEQKYKALRDFLYIISIFNNDKSDNGFDGFDDWNTFGSGDSGGGGASR